mmetsp:Transcript_69700/g.159846  ORF Transcript_69700/g.159846 Transcript_69700/m.159846 type:complete len:91 (+) Transcript_69700:64-336(+)
MEEHPSVESRRTKWVCGLSQVWRTGDEDPESRWEAAGEASMEEPAFEGRPPRTPAVSEVWRTGEEPRTGDADSEPRREDTGDVCLEAPSV